MQAMRASSRLGASMSSSTQQRRGTVCRGLKENLNKIAPATGVRLIRIPSLGHEIVPAPGKMASVAIYAHLASRKAGTLDAEVAKEGMDLYGEYTEEARGHRGSHPNIDILFDVLEKKQALKIEVERE